MLISRPPPPTPCAARRASVSVRGVAAMLLMLVTTMAAPGHIRAASPTSTAMPDATATATPGIVDPGDPRSEGEGAGLIGDPVLVALGVIGLGALASGATLVYLRLTRDE